MAYVHFEDVSEVIVSTQMVLHPEQLVAFLVDSVQQRQEAQTEAHAMLHKVGPGVGDEPEELRQFQQYNTTEQGIGAVDPTMPLPVSSADPRLKATELALVVARKSVLLLEEQLLDLRMAASGNPALALESYIANEAYNEGYERTGGKTDGTGSNNNNRKNHSSTSNNASRSETELTPLVVKKGKNNK
jgi:hypothetical protein